MSTDRDYLAAGLALGGLSDDELAEAQALADADAEFRSEVAAYADIMAEAAESDEPVEVSAATRDAILSIPENHEQQQAPESSPTATPSPPAPTSLSAHRQARRSDDQAEGRDQPQPLRRSWMPWAAAAATIVIAAGLGATVWQQHQRQNELEQELAATQQQLDDSARLMEASDLKTSTADMPEGGTVTVLSSESEQLIRLSPKDIGQPPAGKSMQMWVIGADGPESAGLMSGKPVTIAGETFASGSVFGITVEPEGGSTQPTTDPIVAIDL